MQREIRLKHKDIQDPQTITETTRNKFKEHDLNINVNEVESLHDDFNTGERILNVKTPTLTFSVGDVPWHR